MDLFPEGKVYKLDSANRVAIPANLLRKMKLQKGDYLEVFSTIIDGKWYFCACKEEKQ